MILLGVSIIGFLAGIICAGVALAPRFETPPDPLTLDDALRIVFARLQRSFEDQLTPALIEAGARIAAMNASITGFVIHADPPMTVRTAGGILDIVEPRLFDSIGDDE